MGPAGALDGSEEEVAVAAPRPGMIRRVFDWCFGWFRWLYDWCLGWADTPYGTPALFVMSFAESSFFPIPPDVLQMALSVAKPKRAFFYAAVSALASVLGAVLGWYIGSTAWEALKPFFFDYVPGFTPKVFETVKGLYLEGAFVAILLSAFTPIPFKVFTIASGAFGIGLGTLVVASAIGRSGRFFLVGATIYFFGPKVKETLEKNFNLATMALAVLGIGGFLVIRFVF